ncbi:hypothetical protein PIROE2DRAFT_60754 [Piromyces sp. E2]|nr:hypothetical protein PIROE2DRAFT_60754 [Piromyces sp. E2]|eukprot:OUM64293.1 hypothetical protein PIROE2DRAFT_60754 [Piromyces sp. E2]
MVTEKVIKIIREIFENFSRNIIDNLNNDLMMYLNLPNTLYINKTKDKKEHVANLKEKRMNTIENEAYKNINYDGSNFVKRYLYKDNNFVTLNQQNYVLYNFSVLGNIGNTEDFELYLVETDSFSNSCKTYDDIENKITKMKKNGRKLHLNIYDIDIKNNEEDRGRTISSFFKTNKNNKFILYSFVVIADGTVQQISNFFSLISFRQFSKRKGSLIDRQYEKFLKGKPNDLKYYMEELFKQPQNHQRIPKFKNEFKFPINFYNVHGGNDEIIKNTTIESSTIIKDDDVSIVSNDTIIENCNAIETISPLLSPSIYSDIWYIWF